jgi:hypothetical protein
MVPINDALDGLNDGLNGRDRSVEKASAAGIQAAATVGASVNTNNTLSFCKTNQ